MLIRKDRRRIKVTVDIYRGDTSHRECRGRSKGHFGFTRDSYIFPSHAWWEKTAGESKLQWHVILTTMPPRSSKGYFVITRDLYSMRLEIPGAFQSTSIFGADRSAGRQVSGPRFTLLQGRDRASWGNVAHVLTTRQGWPLGQSFFFFFVHSLCHSSPSLESSVSLFFIFLFFLLIPSFTKEHGDDFNSFF